MISQLFVIILVLLALLITLCVLFYMRGQEVDSLVKQLCNARKDTQKWYNRACKLDMILESHNLSSRPQFKVVKPPKDYDLEA